MYPRSKKPYRDVGHRPGLEPNESPVTAAMWICHCPGNSCEHPGLRVPCHTADCLDSVQHTASSWPSMATESPSTGSGSSDGTNSRNHKDLWEPVPLFRRATLEPALNGVALLRSWAEFPPPSLSALILCGHLDQE